MSWAGAAGLFLGSRGQAAPPGQARLGLGAGRCILCSSSMWFWGGSPRQALGAHRGSGWAPQGWGRAGRWRRARSRGGGHGGSGMGVRGIGDWGIPERGTCRCWALGTPSFGYWDPLGATGAGHGDPFVLGSPPGIRDPLVWDPLGTGYQGLCALLPLGTPGLGIGDPSVLGPWSWASAGPLGTGTITHQHILALEPTGGTGTHPHH